MPALKVCDISIFAESNDFLFKASKLNLTSFIRFVMFCKPSTWLSPSPLPPLVPPSNTGLTGFWRQASGGLGTSFDSLQLLPDQFSHQNMGRRVHHRKQTIGDGSSTNSERFCVFIVNLTLKQLCSRVFYNLRLRIGEQPFESQHSCFTNLDLGI